MADAQTISALFGDDIMSGDIARISTGNVSETTEALKGPGGPFDDMIPAEIHNSDGTTTPAALSPGEFVLSQPIVEFLGDGDVSLGANLLGIMQNNGDALNEVKSILKKYTT